MISRNTVSMSKSIFLEFHHESAPNKTKFGMQLCTAFPREVVLRGGYPLGLIEYIIERMCQVFDI